MTTLAQQHKRRRGRSRRRDYNPAQAPSKSNALRHLVPPNTRQHFVPSNMVLGIVFSHRKADILPETHRPEASKIRWTVVASRCVRATISAAKRRPTWAAKASAVFDQLATLQVGWNTYSASPPAAIAIEFAKRFCEVLVVESFPPSRIAASAVGGVGITFRRGDSRGYVEFRNDGLSYLLLARMADEPSIEPIRNDAASFRIAVQMIREFLDADS